LIGRLLGFLAGLGLAGISGYALYSMVKMLIDGILAANVLLVIAGGILLYLFMALSIVGIIVGGVLAIAFLFD